MEDIQIRPADTGDYGQVFQLIEEFASFIRTPEKVNTTPDRMAEDRAWFRCFVAVDHGRIVGFATCYPAYFSWTGKAFYLDDLYVTEARRGRGIGSRLLDTVIEAARAEQCRKVRWQVSNWNEKAIAFYKKRGAVIDAVEINCDLYLP